MNFLITEEKFVYLLVDPEFYPLPLNFFVLNWNIALYSPIGWTPVTDTSDKETNERTDGWTERRVYPSFRWSLTLNTEDKKECITGLQQAASTVNVFCNETAVVHFCIGVPLCYYYYYYYYYYLFSLWLWRHSIQLSVLFRELSSSKAVRHISGNLFSQCQTPSKAEDTRGRKPAPIFGVEHRRRFSTPCVFSFRWSLTLRVWTVLIALQICSYRPSCCQYNIAKVTHNLGL